MNIISGNQSAIMMLDTHKRTTSVEDKNVVGGNNRFSRFRA